MTNIVISIGLAALSYMMYRDRRFEKWENIDTWTFAIGMFATSAVWVLFV